jgi:hypothetical protein
MVLLRASGVHFGLACCEVHFVCLYAEFCFQLLSVGNFLPVTNAIGETLLANQDNA